MIGVLNGVLMHVYLCKVCVLQSCHHTQSYAMHKLFLLAPPCVYIIVCTDAVVSAAFVLMIALLSVAVYEALSKADGRLMATLLHFELLAWCCPVAYYVLRFASLISSTNSR